MIPEYFPIWIAVYFGVSVLCVPLVDLLGPVSIKNYVLEYDYDNSTGAINIAYRVLAPILCCYIIILLFSAFISPTAGFPYYSWISVILYWAIMVILKLATGRLSIPLAAFIVEIAFSIIVACLVDEVVMRDFFDLGIRAFDDSNIAFQFEVAVFFVAVQAIASLSTRRKYRIGAAGRSLYGANKKRDYSALSRSYGDKTGYRPLVNTSESKLFEYERKYGNLLGDRFSQDPILRMVFFSIMAIEDSNRPAGVRLFERIACVFGAAKTTGIMQQRSDRPLSDDESVVLAAKYVEGMWDSYLSQYARSKQGLFSDEAICFSPSWYMYDYELLANTVEESFSELYGDYCGTRLLNANGVFREVRKFEERNHYGLTLDKVSAPGSICLPESTWLSSYPAYWSNSFTLRTVPGVLESEAYSRLYIMSSEAKTFADVEEAVSIIKKNGFLVEGISFSNKVFAVIRFIASKSADCPIAQDGWTLSR